MDKRFFNIFGLSETEAIAILKAPPEETKDDTDRYIAASQLAYFPTVASISALIETVENNDPQMYNRIARRKAIESLGRLKAENALSILRNCLQDEDCYTVENAVWAIGEIGTEDEDILAEIASLLTKPGQVYRIIIQVLAKLDYKRALEKIRPFTKSDTPSVVSAAIAAVCRLSEDYSQIDRVVDFLRHPNINARRGCIQDLIDAKYYPAIADISRSPVSVVFRLRGIKMLAESALNAGKISFKEIESVLDRTLIDRPQDLDPVYRFDPGRSLEDAINDLYHTDFGRCYAGSKIIIESYRDIAPAALLKDFSERAYSDYGAHYHVVKLLGQLKYAPSYDLLREALHDTIPQFQKSRAAAAIALGNLGDRRAIPELKRALNTKNWSLKYACLLAAEQLGCDREVREILAEDPDWLIRAKATT